MIATIFDTNAYLNLVSQKNFEEVRDFVQRLKSAEVAQGYRAFIYPTVAQELLAHMLDKQPICKPTYTYTKTCVAIYSHCSDSKQNYFRTAPLHELQIAHAYWGIDVKPYIDTQMSYGKLLSEIERQPNCKTVAKYKKQLQQIKDFTRDAESTYVESIEEIKRLVLQAHPGYADWASFLADKNNKNAVTGYVNSPALKRHLAKSMIYALVIDMQAKGCRIPSKGQIEGAIDIYMQDCASSLELQQMLFSHWDDPNFDFGRPERVNTIWDLKILSCVGHRLNNQDEILLVTSDKKMLEAARRTMPTCKICKYEEYLVQLGL